jgi:hypothetical protein
VPRRVEVHPGAPIVACNARTTHHQAQNKTPTKLVAIHGRSSTKKHESEDEIRVVGRACSPPGRGSAEKEEARRRRGEVVEEEEAVEGF